MNTAYILTGGNLGNRQQNLQTAAMLIEEQCGDIIALSALYETAAWGYTEQPDFLNQVLVLQTQLQPEQLMSELLQIEEKMGRIRTVKFGPRIIDIDILLINQLIIKSELLTLPHPALHERRFALTPLQEVASQLQHPVLYKTISQLLHECNDTSNVQKIF